MEDRVFSSPDLSGPEGVVTVRPFSPGGGELKDPFSIFAQPGLVKEQVLGSKERRSLLDDTGEIFLESNLVVNLGRQTLAYLVGGRDYSPTTPVKDWIITKASFGTYDEAPRFTDSTISPQPGGGFTGGENEIVVNPGTGEKKKLIETADWPQEFIVRFEILLAEAEANGFAIREMALWTDNDTLFARKVFPAVNKSQEFGLSFLWRIRM